MYTAASTASTFLACVQLLWPSASASPPNILNLIVDDLRVPVQGSDEDLLLPNLNALRADAVTFTKAYSAIPVCGASRAATLTGRSPTSLNMTTYTDMPKDFTKDVVTVHEYLKTLNYTTMAVGKVWHGTSAYDGEFDGEYDYFKHLNSFDGKYMCSGNAVVRIADDQHRELFRMTTRAPVPTSTTTSRT